MGIKNGSSSTSKAGEISFFARDAAPTGWLIADGTLVSRIKYAGLFLAIGIKYGAGDGSTTFALPNMKDRMPVGAGNLYGVGLTGGSKDAIVVAHSHSATDTGHQHSTPGQIGGFFQYSGGGGTSGLGMPLQASGTTGTGAANISIGQTGGNGTGANMPPYIGLLACIKT